MTEAEYILCMWEERFWPAKVLYKIRASKRQLDPKKKLAAYRVEILCRNKQVNVSHADTKPLDEETIDSIASELGQKKKNQDPLEELIYRRALREALDILRQDAQPESDGLPSTRRKSKGPAQAGSLRSLVPRCQQPLSQKNPCERVNGEPNTGSPTLSQVALTKKELRPSSKRSSSLKCSVSKSEHLSGEKEVAVQSCVFSKTEMAPSLLEKEEPLPKPGTDEKSPCSSKETNKRCCRVQGKSDGENRVPVPPRASTPTAASRKSRAGLTSPCRKLGLKPGLRRTLLGSPIDCVLTELEKGLSEEGESPPRKYSKTSNGKRCPEGLEGSGQEQICTALSFSQEKQERFHLEDLNLGHSPDKSLSECKPEGNESMDANVNLLPLQDFGGDEEGFDPTSSLQLSPIGEPRLSPASQDDEDEELPSILLHQEPCSIERGMLVWCKLPRYPYWPAVVKRVKRRARKANVILIEKAVENKEAKGFCTSLKKLKHFDCEEKEKLVNKARENYSCEIDWCISLINSYRIRVACKSFTGSFLEYCADDMSYTVRRGVPHDLSQMTFPKLEEADLSESLLVTTPTKRLRKVLPDRMRAARDKANKRIVEFIVKAKGADEHLRSILRSKKPSRWLKEFFTARPYVTCTETYLEDDGQQELVLSHLEEVYQEVSSKVLRKINGDRTKFILDVLFPEAIIYAISAVDHIDYKKAEVKYMRGPLVSQREREIFEEEILEKKRKGCLASQSLSPEANQ